MSQTGYCNTNSSDIVCAYAFVAFVLIEHTAIKLLLASSKPSLSLPHFAGAWHC